MTKGHCKYCTRFTPSLDGTGWCRRHRSKYSENGTCDDHKPIYDERHGRPAPTIEAVEPGAYGVTPRRARPRK